ncbi:uncharacterized protein [Musca autumnalis]|uniref:uncharacterized protein n=1 Tax=Musca autumnalis TaxID=221902 RepID=UPI003CF4C737
MVRQRSRRTIEEVYGTKFEGTSKPSANNAKIGGGFQTSQPDHHGYIINSNTPYYTTPALPAPQASLTNNGALNSSRRKTTARNNNGKVVAGGAGHKFGNNKEKEDIGKEFNSNKMKTSRAGTTSHIGGATNANQYHDNKTYRPSYTEHMTTGNGNQHQQQHQPHHHNNHHQHHHKPANQHHQPDEDKDDDTEEFFQLIRQTVENAIGKSISELLNRNFRELSSKIERFSMELKNTNDHLKKIHVELNNKIVHYGEENSRHFRYLCMKSEYDKMFYQHQTMMSTTVIPTNNRSQKLDKRLSPVQTNSSNGNNPNTPENDVIPIPCTCRRTPRQVPSKDAQKSSSSDERNGAISQKSSEVGIREILDQLQRFFAEMKELKKCPNSMRRMSEMMVRQDDCCGAPVVAGGAAGDVMTSYHHDKAMRINKELFQAEYDDDDFEMSSDSMTPRSVENLAIPQHQYGGMTVRTSSTTRTQSQHMNGGGAGGDGGDAS